MITVARSELAACAVMLYTKEHGGDIYGHASHETSLDVDVWPVRNDTAQYTA